VIVGNLSRRSGIILIDIYLSKALEKQAHPRLIWHRNYNCTIALWLRQGQSISRIILYSGYLGDKYLNISNALSKKFWFALILLSISCTSALSQQYLLETGDSIRSQISGISEQPYIARVDVSGNVRLPFLGVFQAAGKTLDELSDDIMLHAAGQLVRVVRNGAPTNLILDERDIFLDIESYRPITVTGAVAERGRVEFEPGLTARAAIGMAGGFALSTLPYDPNRDAVLNGRLQELREAQAWIFADLWRVETLMSGAEINAVPDEYTTIFPDRLGGDVVDIVRRRVENARAQLAQEIAEIEARIELSRTRVSFLKKALEESLAASENEVSRLAVVQGLVDRGLATANTAESAQARAFSATTRLLTTEADLAEAEQQLQTLLGRIDSVDIVFQERLLAEKSSLRRDLALNEANTATVSDQIALSSRLLAGDEDTATFSLILYRKKNGTEQSISIDLSYGLMPGDIVEVVLDQK